MITEETLDELHACRKESCTCGTVMNTPDFHANGCLYIPKGHEILSAAEREAPSET